MLGATLNQKNRDLGSEFSRSHPRELILCKDTFIPPKRPLGDSLDKLFELALLLSMTKFLLRQAHYVLIYSCKDVLYVRLGVAGEFLDGKIKVPQALLHLRGQFRKFLTFKCRRNTAFAQFGERKTIFQEFFYGPNPLLSINDGELCSTGLHRSSP